MATINSTTGAVTGVSAGTSVITYLITGIGGCANVSATATVTVTPVPTAGNLTGTQAICENGTSTLSSNIAGGAWSSATPAVASINASTGVVTGVSAGTSIMTYTVTGTGGCANATQTSLVTVTAPPTAGTISGTQAICANGSSTLTSSVAGGSWSSSNPLVAAINSSTGAVSGVNAGTAVMTYTVTGTGGCANATASTTITVTPVPSAGTIAGTTAICANGSSTLTSSVTGGAWSSATPAVASINAATGAVAGVSAGTAVMTYTITGTGGCADVSTTATVNVTAVPTAGTIAGTTAICANGSSTLTSSVNGGVWSSATPAVATINASTGTLTGISAGTSVITYTVNGTGSCAGVSATTTTVATVSAAPTAGTISGTTAICANGSTTLTSTVIGGVWTSSIPTVAAINSSTGAVTGVNAGTTTMTYTVTGSGSCANVSATQTTVVAVSAVPTAGNISGTAAICANQSSNLTSSVSGGAWSSSNTAVATINAAGYLSGVSAGTTTITYTVTGTGGCANASTTATVNVTAVPTAGTIAGTTAICANGSSTLTSSVTGGAWSSSNPLVAAINSSTGAVSGVNAGTAVMTYTVTGTGGCADATTSTTITVTPVPSAGTIAGTTAICANGSSTLTSNITGGSWSSATPAVASINAATGAVAGVSAGTAVMTYTVTGTGGCADVSTSTTVTVTAVPTAGTIAGTTAICANGSSTLTSSVTGGSWSSATPAVASINASSGAVTGVSAGTSVMTYTVTGTGGCANVSTTATVTVTPVPTAGTLTGTTAICANGSSTLTSSVTGGAWSSATPAVATINTSTGAVTGVSAGTSIMTYTVTGTGGCADASTTASVTVTALPTVPTASATQPTCATPTGSISITSIAGVQYAINGSVYQNSNQFLNLQAGSYAISVRSNANNACVTTGSTIVINAALGAPTLPVANITVQPTCAVPTGTIVVSAPLGAFDYSINGVTYQSSTTFSGLASGTYNLTARRTADQTCVSTALSLTINPVTALPGTPAAIATQPTCAVPTGTINFNTQTGVQYAINGVNYVNGSSFINLAPGNYPISVRSINDATCVTNGATIAIIASAGAPTAPTASATTQPTCATPTGTITVTAPLGAFEYSLDGVNYQTATTFNGLTPGTYNVSARRTTDMTCVSNTTTVSINAVPALPSLPSATVTQPTCAVATGSIAFAAQSGVQYALNGGAYQAGATFASLTPGTYFPYVRNSADASCVSVGSPVVVNAVPSVPSAPSVASITQPVCGTTTGAFTIGNPIGNFTYSINGTSYQASTSFTSLLPGTYSCTARSTTDLTCISAATSVTIAPVPNCIPVATNDVASTNEDTPVTFNLTNNDTDNDGTIDANTVDLNPSTPGIQTTFTNTQGTWSVTAGVMTFTPAAQFNGAASITYTVNDNSGATSNVANITVNVVPVNDAPIANNDSASTTEDTPVSLNVTNNDSDIDGTIDVNTVDLDPTTAGIQNTFVNAQGTWSVTGGIVTFTPNANFNGSAAIDYTVNDNGGSVSNIATITVNVTAVNDAPIANNDLATTNEDTPVTFNITANDTDIDGTINSNSVDLNPAAAGTQIDVTTAQGTWVVTAGNLTFTPAANFNGSASINYTVKDNSGLISNVALITVDVLTLNDAPVANNDAASTNEDTPVTLDVVNNDNDVDGTIDANTVDLDPTAPGIQTTFTNAQGTWTVTNGNLTFTPVANFNGSASINYSVNDNAGATSNVATITITVVSVNDLPVANDDFATTNEDTPVSFNITNNDTDVDGTININTVDLNTTVAGLQTTFVNAQGAWTVASGLMTFTPNANFNGTASIIYTVKDNSAALSNTATVTVNVVSVNDLPVANNDVATTNEDTPVTLNLTNNDTDSDGTIDVTTVDLDPTTPGIQTTFTNTQGTWTVTNGVLTFTPAANFNGSASINYTVNDNSGATSNLASITINVTAVNDAPIANNDVATTNENTPVNFNITNNDIDIDGSINPSSVDLNQTIAGFQTSFNNAQGSWNVVAGVVTYTPALNFNGTTSITYTVNDNSGAVSNIATITITVLSVNNPPVANNDLTTTIEDTPVSLNITNNDTDIDGTIDVNTVDLDLSIAGIQTTVNTAQGSASVAAGVLTFTPVLNFNGSASIAYRVNDNSGATSNIGMVTIQVSPVNDAPVLDNEVLVVNYNGSQTGDLTDAGDFDPDGTNLVVNTTPLVGPQNGTIAIAQDGTFTYQPNANFVGTDLVVVQVCDQGSPLPFLCASDTIFITVNACSLLDANQDCDLDGLTNGQETALGTDPSNPDTDGDGVLDGTEVADGTNPLNPCSLVFASQTVAPSTAWNNLDCDNDGLSNGGEIAAGTDPTNPDTDGDGVLDGTEVADGTNPLNPCSLVFASQTVAPSTAWNNLDCDNDGLSNGGEIAAGTDPTNPDTDGDGVLDGTEVADGTNPTDPCSFVFASQTVTPSSAWNNLDCDNDGLSNGGEIAAGTDPTNPDTDGDGVLDGTEVTDGTNPTDPCSFVFASQTVTPSSAWNNLDCDNDGLTNGQEAGAGTDPNNPDTDGDGVIDGDEFNDGTNPIDPCDYILSSQTVTPSPEWAALDCDNDGLTNGEESGNGSDPTDPCDPFVSGSNCSVEIIVPEAFSPDGDGTNETFIIEGLQYFDDNEIIIFNRWGSEVFRMSPYDNSWDGTSQSALNVGGDALPTGTYFYILDTKTEKYGVIKGYIYLKR
ncbi:MAG: tandem-95 repeat protein [Crocinitomicaceae bacterium]|nr:tandem-95 repeat protein [Crocinitomicaceae bacterium]